MELVQPDTMRWKVLEPVLLLGKQRFSAVDIRIRVKGGGHVSQIYAIRQAIAKGIVAFYQKCEWVGGVCMRGLGSVCQRVGGLEWGGGRVHPRGCARGIVACWPKVVVCVQLGRGGNAWVGEAAFFSRRPPDVESSQ